MRYKLLKEISRAKPKLRAVSPVSYWFILLMSVFNFVLGLSFLVAADGVGLDRTLSAVTVFIPIWGWALLFSALGFLKLHSIIVNNWTIARYSLLVGVALKSGWAIALIFRTLEIPDNIFLTLTWVTIAIVQVICYIHFLPPAEPRHLNGEVIDEQ